MDRTLAVLTDALEHLSREEALAWCAERGAPAVELGTGGYSAAPHADRLGLLGSATARRELLDELRASGTEIVALNVSGNPLHPDPAVASAHAAALRETVLLATELGVERVVAMSGCPGGGPQGPGAWPVFAGGAWLPDMEELWSRQWAEEIAPFWTALSSWATAMAAEVTICLELHPGTSIYNAASFELLRDVTGENVAVNLDPSHFWWQGIDPVATVERVGGRIGFAHGKDTIVHADRVALHGVLDFRWPATADEMPWHFCAVGHGRPAAEWARLLVALDAAGYAGPISVEHEDPQLTPEAGIEASLGGLREALDLAAATSAPALD